MKDTRQETHMWWCGGAALQNEHEPESQNAVTKEVGYRIYSGKSR